MAEGLIRSPQNEPFTIYNDMTNPPSPAISGPPAQEQTAAAGFGQVDLLTVLGVLLLLAPLLTPALARTRVQDQAFVCLSHLRQLMAGWQMYSQDNRGALPGAFDWVVGLMSYDANNPDNTNTYYLQIGKLGPYVKNLAAYKCPSDKSVALIGTVRLPRVRTISMSQTLRPKSESSGWVSSPPWTLYERITDIVRPAPANLWVLLDENPDSINDGAFAVVMDYQGNTAMWQDGPNILHNGGCNFAFADGHGETKRWQDPRTYARGVTYSNVFPYGIRQPNNPDIQWVQNRTTARQ